jgi:hypothetical protein
MDYKILKGREIEIRGESVTVESIDECENSYTGVVFYRINDRIRADQHTVLLQVNRAKREITKSEKSNLGFFARLLQVYGIFMWRIIHESNTRFGTVFGKRDYGFHTCSIFLEVNFGRKSWTIEFVYNDKQEFENGVLPYVTCPLKKIL